MTVPDRQIFNPRQDSQGHERKANQTAGRPKPAASLIVVKDGDQVLMGRRNANLRFMPGKYVFPGGRPHRNDGRIEHAGQLPTHTLFGGPQSLTHRLALSAIRETYEETGLRLATPGQPSVIKGWRGFCNGTHIPTLVPLRFYTRAITPPSLRTRYDTRFFVTDAEHLLPGDPIASDELEDVRWVSITEALDLPIPVVTRYLLEDLPAWLQSQDKPARFARVVRGAMKICTADA